MPEAHRLSVIAPIQSGTASVVYGSRFMSGQAGASFASVAGSRFLTLATNVLFGSHLTDMETCCNIKWSDGIHAVRLFIRHRSGRVSRHSDSVRSSRD